MNLILTCLLSQTISTVWTYYFKTSISNWIEATMIIKILVHHLKSLGPIDRKFLGHGENDGFDYDKIINNAVVFANIQTLALWLIDWIEFYAVSPIFQPCNGNDYEMWSGLKFWSFTGGPHETTLHRNPVIACQGKLLSLTRGTI